MGTAALCGALCFGELAARYPEAGGSYVYLREAYGPARGLPLRLEVPARDGPRPDRGARHRPRRLRRGRRARPLARRRWPSSRSWRSPPRTSSACASPRPSATASPSPRSLSSSASWRGASPPAPGDASHFVPFLARRPGAPPLVPALAGALVLAFFSFGGWWEAAKLAGEVRDPQRALPRALALGVGAVTLLYASVSAVFLYLVPIEQDGSPETFAAQAGVALFGPARRPRPLRPRGPLRAREPLRVHDLRPAPLLRDGARRRGARASSAASTRGPGRPSARSCSRPRSPRSSWRSAPSRPSWPTSSS